MTVLVEPDRQRFARFASEAVSALGGSAFALAPRLVAALRLMREQCERAGGGLGVELRLEDERLSLVCGRHSAELYRLPGAPDPAAVETIATRLRSASETADPELLKRRNARIARDMEEAKARARREMAELESTLARKKHELRESIRKAETDGLTGLLNRGAYDHRLEQGVLRANRQGEPLSLILLDLDKFKEINDTHGHQYGDEYLKKMADSLRQAAREDVDHLCRFGGDEFAIIVYAPANVAERIAATVLELMAARTSIGIAELLPGEDEESLVSRADAALYEAKHRGRGQAIRARGDARGEMVFTQVEDA